MPLTLPLIPSLSLLVLLLPVAASPAGNTAGQISVVIPHYIRTANTHRVVSALVHMPIVGQVLVACGHPSYPYASTHPKVQVLDDTEGNTKLYTMRRFQAALQAKHDMILHLDDDIIPTVSSLEMMASELAKDPGAALRLNVDKAERVLPWVQ